MKFLSLPTMIRPGLFVLLVVSIQISQSSRPSRRYVPHRSNIYRRHNENDAESMIDTADDDKLMDELDVYHVQGDNYPTYHSMDDAGDTMTSGVAEMLRRAVDDKARRARITMRRLNRNGNSRRLNQNVNINIADDPSGLIQNFADEKSRRARIAMRQSRLFGAGRRDGANGLSLDAESAIEHLADESPEADLYVTPIYEDSQEAEEFRIPEASDDLKAVIAEADTQAHQQSLIKNVLKSVLHPQDPNDVVVFNYDNQPSVRVVNLEDNENLDDEYNLDDNSPNVAIGRRCDTCGGPSATQDTPKTLQKKVKDKDSFLIDIASVTGVRVHSPNSKPIPIANSQKSQH